MGCREQRLGPIGRAQILPFAKEYAVQSRRSEQGGQQPDYRGSGHEGHVYSESHYDLRLADKTVNTGQKACRWATSHRVFPGEVDRP